MKSLGQHRYDIVVRCQRQCASDENHKGRRDALMHQFGSPKVLDDDTMYPVYSPHAADSLACIPPIKGRAESTTERTRIVRLLRQA